jgi:transcriptional regulator with XRE-family HTH domain
MEAARQAALDAMLDAQIEAAAAPLRVAEADVLRFDAQQPNVPPLDAKQAHRLHLLVATARAGSAELGPAALSFGELVRIGREAAHLGLPDLARRLHVHRDYLTGLESGTRSPLALGPAGARRLVTLLSLPPQRAAAALAVSMRAALIPTPEFAARMRRGMPRNERLKVLEEALPQSPGAEQEHAWRTLIDAVAALDE